MRKAKLILVAVPVLVLWVLYAASPRAQQNNVRIDGILVSALPSACPSPVPGGGVMLQYVTDDQNACTAGAALLGGGNTDCIGFCSRATHSWLALGTLGASQSCANGLLQTGVSGGFPICSPPPLSTLALAQIHYAALAALGPSPTPLPYWCIDCRQNTIQCAPAGVGTPAGVMAVPVATASPFPNSVIFSCPNFAASAIASASPTATPALSVSITGAPAAGPTPLAVAFAATVTGGASPYTYSWAPGDAGTPAAGPTPSHTYTTGGTYTMTLTVTDANSVTAKQVKTILTTGPTYYVAPTGGSDSNNGLTSGAPFATLAKCQTMMQSGLKVCTLLNGNSSPTFTLGANMVFTTADNGETWMAGAGQSPIIEGNGNFNIQATSTTGLQVYGITFDNLAGARANFPYEGFAIQAGATPTFRWNIFTNCNQDCILLNGTPTSTIDSNTFNGLGPQTTTNAFSTQAVAESFGASNNTFTHNLCENLDGDCIVFARGATDPNNNNNTIDRNLSINVDTGCYDCGVYYFFDAQSGTGDGPSTGNSITNNALYGGGSETGITGSCAVGHCDTKGIYLDQAASNTTITGNILGSKPGNWPIFIHCGGHNTVSNNVIDVSDIGLAANYATVGYQNGCSPTGTMTSNVFSHNVVYDSGAWSSEPAGMYWISGAGLTNPSSTTNDYWSPSGSIPNPSGIPVAITDANPFNLNPNFTNPALNLYTVNNATVISDISWTTLATNQGPLNSPFVSTGGQQ